MKKFPVLVLFAAFALSCSSSSKSGEPASVRAPLAGAPTPTPTPSALKRLNPDIVEETATYTVERYRKSDYIRVDATHIRHPVIPRDVEFFKEDDTYYYVYNPKVPSAEERGEPATTEKANPPVPPLAPTPAKALADYGMPEEDFEDLTPARVHANFRLEEVAGSGLPTKGMWRHSFVLADINGDGIPDVVSPPSRLGADTTLQVFLGDGQGKFARQKLTYTEDGKPKSNFGVLYGGVAVGDIDGDGKLDVVIASHTGGLVSLFGEGEGRYTVVRKGLPGREFSTQAVALVDVNGDGKLDIVASADTYELGASNWDPHQVRVYLSDGARGWKYAPDALIDAAYSNSIAAWDYNHDGKLDVLTGSQAYGAVQLLWKNEGNGKFTTGYFPQIEIHGFHFAMAPGTFGKERLAAFADAFTRSTNAPKRLEAEGISVYSFESGAWTRHRILRKKDGKSSLYALAMGDLDGDGLDDVVFADSSDPSRLRIFLQQADGSFKEADDNQEPRLDSPGQCVRLADLDRDGRLDIVVSKTYGSGRPQDPGGWTVYLNRK